MLLAVPNCFTPHRWMAGALTLATLLVAGIIGVAAPAAAQDAIYGSQLMTQQQVEAYRERMANAPTQVERDRLSYQHYQEMQARAKRLGVVLPYAPPPLPPAGPAPGEGHQAGPRVTTPNAQTFAPPKSAGSDFGRGFSSTPGFRVRTGIGVDPAQSMRSWNGYPPNQGAGPGTGYQPLATQRPQPATSSKNR